MRVALEAYRPYNPVMSKEKIDSITRHLRLHQNPKYYEGAKMLESYTQMLYEQGLIPLSEEVPVVMHHPAGFEYDRVNGLFIKDDEEIPLTQFENVALSRLFETPNTYVPSIELSRAMTGVCDLSYLPTVRVHVTRLRHKIPVEDEMKNKVLESRNRYGYRINL